MTETVFWRYEMMSFAVYADGTANLPGSLLEGITLLPITYTMNDVSHTYTGDKSR